MQRVPIEQLVDLDALRKGERDPSPHRIREALPNGWVLDEDPRFARRDLRILARDGWVLVLGLVCFGAVGLGMFYATFPRGLKGIGVFVGLIGIVIVAGGIAGPIITRALTQRGPR